MGLFIQGGKSPAGGASRNTSNRKKTMSTGDSRGYRGVTELGKQLKRGKGESAGGKASHPRETRAREPNFERKV